MRHEDEYTVWFGAFLDAIQPHLMSKPLGFLELTLEVKVALRQDWHNGCEAEDVALAIVEGRHRLIKMDAFQPIPQPA